jgi:hypothetical protein
MLDQREAAAALLDPGHEPHEDERHRWRYYRLMNRFMPRWQLHREELNRAPLAGEDWSKNGAGLAG